MQLLEQIIHCNLPEAHADVAPAVAMHAAMSLNTAKMQNWRFNLGTTMIPDFLVRNRRARAE